MWDLLDVFAVAGTQTDAETATCIVESLLSLPEYQNARRISVYLSMPSGEVHTAAIVRDALSSGKKVFIPYFYKLSSPQPGHLASAMDMLELDSLQDYDGLEADKWGIPTPTEESISRRNNCFGGRGKSEGEVVFREAREHGLDLVITPGLGFDGELRRIGRGMGFYDSFFARCGTYSSLTGSRIPWTGQYTQLLSFGVAF